MNSLAVYYLDTKSLDQHKPRCTVSTASFTRDRFFFPPSIDINTAGPGKLLFTSPNI